MPATTFHPDNDVAVAEAGRTTHLFLGVCLIAVLSFFTWASVSTLDIVSQATGEIIPASQVKSIQHLEGGIVREISVREGELVEKGQQLVVLERTQTTADVGELQVRLASLSAEISRLEAESTGQEKLVFPQDFEAEQPQLVRQTLSFFENRRKAQKNRINSQSEAVTQRRQSINELMARIRNQTKSLKLMEEQIAISNELMKDNLTNRYNHLDLLKEASGLRGQTEGNAAALSRTQSALKEAEAQLAGIRDEFREQASKELEEARLQFNELTLRVRKFRDSLQRTVLRSPVDGVVKSLYVTTIGGVLRPGETVADVVPGGDRLIIEARLETQDIGYVEPGQLVLVKLTSADAMRFGNLDGTVTNVSPDTLVTEEGVPYYKVRIETENDRFQRGDLQYRLFPGMQVIASILTGKRTVMEYLLGPLLNSMGGAMTER